MAKQRYYGSSSSSSSSSGSGPAAFLESLAALGVGVQASETDDAESRVMTALADGAGKDLAEIIAASGHPPLGQLLGTLDRLEKFGLLFRQGALGDERFALSPGGTRAARTMGLYSAK